MLEAVSGQGVPVVTVLLAGRVLYTSAEINLCDAFVAAWGQLDAPAGPPGGCADRARARTIAQPSPSSEAPAMAR